MQRNEVPLSQPFRRPAQSRRRSGSRPQARGGSPKTLPILRALTSLPSRASTLRSHGVDASWGRSFHNRTLARPRVTRDHPNLLGRESRDEGGSPGENQTRQWQGGPLQSRRPSPQLPQKPIKIPPNYAGPITIPSEQSGPSIRHSQAPGIVPPVRFDEGRSSPSLFGQLLPTLRLSGVLHYPFEILTHRFQHNSMPHEAPLRRLPRKFCLR